jgi:hypothetical protein
MTKDEAIRFALEALRKAMQGNLVFDEAMEAFKAIEAALEAKAENARELGLDYEPVQEPDLAKAYREELDKLSRRNYELRMENAEIKAALLSRSDGEAKDEPVAWLTDTGSVWKSWGKDTDLPLYTTPPQRKPLTDEEIQNALEAEFLGCDAKRNWQDDWRVARAIEAKLKERNT